MSSNAPPTFYIETWDLNIGVYVLQCCVHLSWDLLTTQALQDCEVQTWTHLWFTMTCLMQQIGWKLLHYNNWLHRKTQHAFKTAVIVEIGVGYTSCIWATQATMSTISRCDISPATLQTAHVAQCNTACVYQGIFVKHCQDFYAKYKGQFHKKNKKHISAVVTLIIN